MCLPARLPPKSKQNKDEIEKQGKISNHPISPFTTKRNAIFIVYDDFHNSMLLNISSFNSETTNFIFGLQPLNMLY